ncbi:MAG: HTTM domain-containing protein [Planctomycetia bacterium]|nr:HTTM domain-containing protein [Planctomycetia bacterium]
MSKVDSPGGEGITVPPADARSLWRRWVAFWFPAADPTTLGFIRITTGLLVLYIHLAYSVDLQAFFGKHGWYSSKAIDQERKEYPWQATQFWDWDPQEAIPAKVPEYPHRRKAVIGFIRDLPADKAQRDYSLRFLNRVSGMYNPPDTPENPVLAVQALNWVREMGILAERREAFLTVLTGGQLETPHLTEIYTWSTPDYLRNLPQAERNAIADEVRAFWTVLPKRTETDREYVLNHLIEMPPAFRKAFVKFLNDLPADPVERAKKIDYLEYWNNDREKSVWTGHQIFSVWFHVTDPTQMALIHVAILLLIVLYTLGLFTRVTSVLVWLAVVSYIHRTQQVLFGMDTMMNILLFYLMIGNSGAALSIDRLIARYRAVRASLKRCGAIDDATRQFLAAPPPSRSAGFALRLIQVHFCFIYVAAGLAKLKGPAWWGGQAFWDVVVNPEFTLMQYEWYEKLLRATAEIRPLYYILAAGGVWFTLFVEIAGPFLMWTRLRWLMMFLASAMHAAIGVLMGLNLFELLMMIMILAFMPDRVIRDRLAGALGLKRLTFAYNSEHATHAKAAALAVALDVDNQVTIAPDKTASVPAVSGADLKPTSGAEGFEVVAKELRLFSALSTVRQILTVGAFGVLGLAAIGGLMLLLGSILSTPLAPITWVQTNVGLRGIALSIIGSALILLVIPAIRRLFTQLLFPTPPNPKPAPPTMPKPTTPTAAS